MVKAIIFFIFITGVMFYPLIINNNKTIKIVKVKKLPNVEVEKANFYIYDKILSKKGNFKKLNIYKNKYIIIDLNATDLLKSQYYQASKTIFKNIIATGYNVWYKNRDIKLYAKTAYYNKNTNTLHGKKFELYSKNFEGFGESFEIDNKKNLNAQKITYYLKEIK